MEPTLTQTKTCNVETKLNSHKKYNESRYSSTCKLFLNENDKIRKINSRRIKTETILAKCEKCDEEKPLKDFAKLKKYYKKKICLYCYPLFLREQKNEWCRNKSNNNINYRLKKSLASRLRNVLTKNDTTMNYVGCNIQYLRKWFEYNFTEEMNWDNYDSYWSIDHIVPTCKFDLMDETEKMKCWNWTNMMPVLVNFNSSKKKIDMNQINYILEKIQTFKEEGSTTKWFSEEFTLNMELIQNKLIELM
jgi:hypothetical protein